MQSRSGRHRGLALHQRGVCRRDQSIEPPVAGSGRPHEQIVIPDRNLICLKPLACKLLHDGPASTPRPPARLPPLDAPSKMLKKIATTDVQLGMFLQAMEGSWLAHPFWKTKFVIREQRDLDALRSSGVPAVWIDLSKGSDLPAGAAAAMSEPPVRPAATHAPDGAGPGGATGHAQEAATNGVSLREEMERAAKIVRQSRDAVIDLFGQARLGKAVSSERCLPLVEEVAGSVARNPSALISLARLKTKDDYTYMHSVAVCALMVALARQLGLDEAQTREAGMAGLLHDIGKMMVPLELLNKAGPLTEPEFGQVRCHPRRGYEALKEGRSVSEAVLDVCLHHHEKIDGSGYPDHLIGDQIGLMARMGAVCDVYDAVTSVRPYKEPWDPGASIQRMAQWTGHFDRVVFQAFVKSVGIYPVGTLVRLESGRLAVVVDRNPANLVAPTVKVFYSVRSKMPIPVQLVDLGASTCRDRIVGRESSREWGFKQLDDLWRLPSNP